MPEVGSASLAIIPSFKGLQANLERGSSKALEVAGKSGGEKFGDAAAKEGGEGFSSKIGPLLKKGALAAGGIAGIALGVGLAGALERGALGDKLAAQLGVGEKKSAELGKVAGDLYAGAWGDSMESVNGAIRSVVTNLDGFRNASKAKLKDVTATVLDLNSAFDEEPEAITRAASQMVRTGLAKSSKQALDIITRGFQTGADKSQDLLDTFNEYGTQFRKLGLNGKKATGLLSQGLKAGARDADIVADAIKEFSIRTLENLETTNAQGEVNMTALGAAFVNVLPKAKDMYEAQDDLAAGGKRARETFDLMLDGLRNLKDPADRAKTAVALFGTQAEDMGAALYALDPTKATDALGKVGGAAKRMGDTLNNNAAAKIESFKRTMQGKLIDFVGNKVVPVLEDKVIPAVEDFGDWFNDEGIPAIKNFHDEAKPIVGVLKGIAEWAGKLPTGAKLAGLAALVGGVGYGKLRGGHGALGTLGKAVGLAKPVPVFVTNAGALGGPGGSGPKIPPAIIPTGEALTKGAKLGSRLRGIAPILPAAGALGNDRLPKMLPAMTDAEIERWKSVNNEAGKFADATRKLPNQMDIGKTAAEGLLSEILKVERSDPKVNYTAPGFDVLLARTREYNSLLDGLNNRIVTTIMRTRYVKNDTGEGGGDVPQPPGRSGGNTFDFRGSTIEAKDYNDFMSQLQNRTRSRSLDGVG